MTALDSNLVSIESNSSSEDEFEDVADVFEGTNFTGNYLFIVFCLEATNRVSFLSYVNSCDFFRFHKAFEFSENERSWCKFLFPNKAKGFLWFSVSFL